jgi:uncharacterized protein (TIGR02001 family)
MYRGILALIGLLLAGDALAQVSAQVSAASDNVYRGVSLTDSRPAAAAELNYDSDAGWFVGGQASETRLYREYGDHPEYTVDAGFAHALTAQLTWEAGATYSTFPGFTFWNYAEGFAGVLGENWNARIYYSPNYFGRQQRTVYAEFNYSHALGERLRLLAHVGALQGLSAAAGESNRTLDASVGVGAKFNGIHVQFAWVTTNRTNFLYPIDGSGDRQKWVLSLAYLY